ncbi:MAG: indole-3-glycerol phosphate synthase [Natronomonas sp.]|jgi:indole-3-glycerol phosphate synthase|uniref:indole-3-glycerol phosphate synthase n=1 Tax=Natronomonas sp. TaxID=2184060 RepID=UPI003989A5F0
MNTSDELAPAVRSILDSAAERAANRERGARLSVDPRSLPAAFDAAKADGRVPLIAEVKPTSPTTEGERTDDPVDLAKSMVEGGAAALSVLTEPEHFGGSAETLTVIREAVDVPVLRKDFIVDEAQLDAVEADVVLLIVRFVDDLEGLLAAARERGFQVLVEAHTADEVETALAAGADIIGVNNRDLAQLEVDLGTFERVEDSIPVAARESVTLIAESGIATQQDVSRMRRAGADGLLVGSAIMDGPVRENTERLTNV